MITNYYNEAVKKGEKSIFLAGPSPRSIDVHSWRPRALAILKYLGYEGIVYLPETNLEDKEFNYDDQIEWETEALANAEVIVFWIPRKLPEMPGFTTNVEFGEWFKSGKIVYGRPDSSEKNKYLDKRYTMHTGEKPENNLEDVLKKAILKTGGQIDMQKSYELQKITEAMKICPESKYLVGEVQFTPESYGSKANGISFGKILFPEAEDNALNEFNRTMLSVVLYHYLKDNLYERFTDCQQGETKLTEASFNELRQFILTIIDSDEKEKLLLYYLVINDLGKSQYMINQLKEIGVESIDHDVVLKQLVEKGMIPSFETLTSEYQSSLKNVLIYGINFGQFIQGECTPYSLSPLVNLTPFEINIMLVEAMLDIAGALGHKIQNGSMIINQSTAENLVLGAKIIAAIDSEETMERALYDFLDKKADKCKIGYFSTVMQRRVATRISLMLRLSSVEEIKVVEEHMKKEWLRLMYLGKELAITGFENDKAILMYYSPALLNNAREYFKKENPKTALKETLNYCIPFFERVLRMVRAKEEVQSGGEITVMLREPAIVASQNPRELKNFDVKTLDCE